MSQDRAGEGHGSIPKMMSPTVLNFSLEYTKQFVTSSQEQTGQTISGFTELTAH